MSDQLTDRLLGYSARKMRDPKFDTTSGPIIVTLGVMFLAVIAAGLNRERG